MDVAVCKANENLSYRKIAEKPVSGEGSGAEYLWNYCLGHRIFCALSGRPGVRENCLVHIANCEEEMHLTHTFYFESGELHIQ